MSSIILYHDGKYNVHGTICDQPLFMQGCTQDELRNWWVTKYGFGSEGDLNRGILRAHQYGTSSRFDGSLADTIVCNRAGPGESCLSLNEYLEQFL